MTTALSLEAIDAYEIVDPAFAQLRGDVGVRRLAGGQRWAEGPVYVPAGRYVLWSDISNDRLMRRDETDAPVSVFQRPAGYPNGNALDAQGRPLTCEQGLRRIVHFEPDGRRTVLAEAWQGKQLDSPNDIAVAPDGTTCFTDATYGVGSYHAGIAAETKIGACSLYPVDPASGCCELIADGFELPTGIACAPGGRRLDVADSRANHLHAFSVSGATAARGPVIFTNDVGNADSMAIDAAGRIQLAGGDSVLCMTPQGDLLGRIPMPEAASNVEFGGQRRNCLFITASTSLYSIMLATTGAARCYDGSPS